MDYDKFFAGKIGELKAEGIYRVFADLERQAGNFPHAKAHIEFSLDKSAAYRQSCEEQRYRNRRQRIPEGN